jgi:hypothetical protein
MRKPFLIYILLVLLALGTATVRAQAAPVSIKQVSDQDGALTLVATVLDADGRPVAGLPNDAFTVQVDGTSAPVEQVRYSADPQVPLGLVLAIDVSRPIRWRC